tara:strand:+ start:2948 stop:3904 length:957 start_codon:yes stop_codon:yes gene_type:complete
MNNYETNFEDYTKNYIDIFNIEKYINFLDKNLIIYGESGIGKYSFVLNLIKYKSPTELKYDKKMVVTFNKNDFYFKISDVHYEIDISLLGCNSKLLWHELYNHIVDSILSKKQGLIYIVLKNFNKINNELLDIFYTYMQSDMNNLTTIKFIIITESICFLPDNIFTRCKLITLDKPSKTNYAKILEYKLDKNSEIENLRNIKDQKKDSFKINNLNKLENLDMYSKIVNEIINLIKDKKDFTFSKLREVLYDICIFEFNIEIIIFNLVKVLKQEKLLDENQVNKILIENYKFLKLYYNNYRPIYHLEKIIIYITVEIWK